MTYHLRALKWCVRDGSLIGKRYRGLAKATGLQQDGTLLSHTQCHFRLELLETHQLR